MIQVDFKMVGNEQLQKQFSALGERVQKRIMIRALKKCTKPLETRMKELAPVSEKGVSGNKLSSRNHQAGYLKASIGTVVGRGSNFPAVWVRPRFKGKWDPWYMHFPMAGTKRMKKDPNPFVDEAWSQMESQITESLKTDLETNIQNEINRL
jgi:HK97 gp10 family phage protein